MKIKNVSFSAVIGMACATTSECTSALANTECVSSECECASGYTGTECEGNCCSPFIFTTMFGNNRSTLA